MLVAIATSILAGGLELKKAKWSEKEKKKDEYWNQSSLLYDPIVKKGKSK